MSDAEDRLMRYFDGELADEEAARVERMVAQSADARALLLDFERVGIVVRAVAEEQGARADGIADRVMSELERPSAVRGISSAKAGPARGRLIPFAPALGLALAAAAAVALLVRSHPREQVAVPSGSASGSVSVAQASVAPPGEQVEEAVAGDPDTGASIESVDFGAQNGTIFMVASGLQVTPVVWLVDESARSGGKMKPL